MKNLKKISLFILAFIMFQQTNCSENQNSENLEFPPHTTEKYMYNKTITEQAHGTVYTAIFGKHPNGISITDTTSEDFFSNRVTRKKIETKTENGVSITTTETWISRNPSYLTWINGAIFTYAIASVAMGAVMMNSTANLQAAAINSNGKIQAAEINAKANLKSDKTNDHNATTLAERSSSNNQAPRTQVAEKRSWF